MNELLENNDGWSETPDFTAWEIEEEKLFDWSQPLAKIESKYKVAGTYKSKVPERDKLDSGWGTSFNMVVKNYQKSKAPPKVKEKKTLQFLSNEQYQALNKVSTAPKFDIEPPKDNSDAPFVNFHYED